MINRTEYLRLVLGKKILTFNIIISIIVLAVFMFKGFDIDEFGILVGILGPITAIYVGSISTYLSKNFELEITDVNFFPKTSVFKLAVNIVYIHFIVITLLILGKGLFNVITFKEMVLIFGFIETSYGGCISHLLTSIFKE